MYSRVFINAGELYKETPLIITNTYTLYDHEGYIYIGKPGKVYLEVSSNPSGETHPDFSWYVSNYDTSVLGSINTVGIQANGDVEFYFDNPENIDVIAEHYGLPRPFEADVLVYQGATLMSIRFNPSKEAYLYKGYTTLDESGLRPVAKMYIDELDDYLGVYHKVDKSSLIGIKKLMYMDKDKSIPVDWLEEDLITIGGVQYRPSDYDYVRHNGYANETVQGDPWLNCKVPKLHE